MVKMSHTTRNVEVTHEKGLNDLTTQTPELADIRTRPGHSDDVMAEAIATVRGIKAFTMVCRNH